MDKQKTIKQRIQKLKKDGVIKVWDMDKWADERQDRRDKILKDVENSKLKNKEQLLKELKEKFNSKVIVK